ncbi:MAG: response regulator transcription factor [Chloroflexi bacterium]|nr:response regulator transcription factor [Chloroflexota bacterium]MBT7080495.1 response regulator transcription factor [Chloroflexota bacterium]MBT7288934.1 response regulator transcription factor [Chloroflexota bacterium]
MYRVIAVDDDIEVIKWLRSLFANSDDFDMVGETVNSGEAIRLVKSLKPDILISDVYLPQIDGFELARYIKENFDGIKVILISAHKDKVYERLAKEEGALTFIPKTSISLNTLRHALQPQM